MRARVTLLMTIAVLAAAMAAFLVVNRLQQAERSGPVSAAAPAPVVKPPVTLLVATRTLASGTTLESGDVRRVSWPADLVPPDTITPEEVTFGQTLIRLPVAQGAPLVASQLLTREGGTPLSYLLAPGRVAKTIAVSETGGLAGHLMPGNRVDILFTHAQGMQVTTGFASAGSVDHAATQRLLVDVSVLAVDQTLDDTEGKPRVHKTATLDLSPKEAEMLALAETVGSLSLALHSAVAGTDDPRPLRDVRRPEPRDYTLDADISALLQIETAAAEPPPPPPNLRKIRVFRGTAGEDVEILDNRIVRPEAPAAAPPASPLPPALPPAAAARDVQISEVARR